MTKIKMATSMGHDEFTRVLGYATDSLGLPFKLRGKQVETVRSLYHGHDTVAVLPTGFGKSTIFQLLPWLMQAKHGKHSHSPMIVVVISPINSIMEDRVQTLTDMGISPCVLNIEGSGDKTYSLQFEGAEGCINNIFLFLRLPTWLCWQSPYWNLEIVRPAFEAKMALIISESISSRKWPRSSECVC